MCGGCPVNSVRGIVWNQCGVWNGRGKTSSPVPMNRTQDCVGRASFGHVVLFVVIFLFCVMGAEEETATLTTDDGVRL